MFSVIIPTCVATQRCIYPHIQLVHHRHAFFSPFVLKKVPLYFLNLAADRDRTGSHRSEPSSRTTLISEQLNPWNHLQLQDVMSRHRGTETTS